MTSTSDPPRGGSAAAPSDSWTRSLVARASTLGERIAGTVALTPADPETTARRRRRWVDAVSPGDEAAFASRLRRDGIDPDRVELLLGDAQPSETDAIPVWAAVVVEAIAGASPDECAADPAISEPIPADVLTVPFLRAARTRLEAIEPAPEWLADSARIDCERWLVRTLSRHWGPMWDIELAVARDLQWGRITEQSRRAEGWTGRELRDAVGRSQLARLADRMEARPSLARLLGTVTAQWIDATAEFRRHASADLDVIATEFAGERELGAVVAVAWGLSDPHRGGRSVAFVTFESGVDVVYKPKDLRGEAALSGLLQWLDDAGFRPSLAPLRVVGRGDHGWVERAHQRPVADVDAAGRYYERAGGLLALMSALGGGDCHYENVVAAGEQPHLVDGETILQPPTGLEGDDDWAVHEAGRQLSDGVLGTGLLPAWFIPPGGSQATDLSGLGRFRDQAPIQPGLRWRDVGTDLERLVSEDAPLTASTNELELDGQLVRVEDYETELVRGFESAYSVIERGRDELTAADGPLAALAPAPVRVILRPTRLYARALKVADEPRHHGEGVDRSIGFERLARSVVSAERPELLWSTLRQELHDLERADVPYFETAAQDVNVHVGVDGPPLVLRMSALANARRQLAVLGPDDRALQVAYIRASLATRRETSAPIAGDVGAVHGELDPVDAARRVGEILLEHAVRSDGSLAWLGALQHEQTGRFQIRPTGPDLYEGQPGIALLFAALTRLDGDTWRTAFDQTLAGIVHVVETSPAALTRMTGIGGGSGVGGLVHAFVRCAELLDDRPMLDAATNLAGAVDPEAIERDRVLDLMGGSGGLVLGMLSLHDATGDPTALALAQRAGDHLLARQRPNPAGGASWHTMPDEPDLQGIAHGASGMALALCRLAAVTGERRYADAAVAALDFELALRSDDGGWPDLRGRASGDVDTRWCYGAPGIGMTRLAMLETGAIDASRLRDDLAVAARCSAAPSGLDHLCCGMAGVAEFSRALGEEAPVELTSTVEEWVAWITGRILTGRPARLMGPTLVSAQNPGLYQGLSGVALALLGHADRSLPVAHAWA